MSYRDIFAQLGDGVVYVSQRVTGKVEVDREEDLDKVFGHRRSLSKIAGKELLETDRGGEIHDQMKLEEISLLEMSREEHGIRADGSLTTSQPRQPIRIDLSSCPPKSRSSRAIPNSSLLSRSTLPPAHHHEEQLFYPLPLSDQPVEAPHGERSIKFVFEKY